MKQKQTGKAGKVVKLINRWTGDETVFQTQTEAAKYLKVGHNTVNDYIRGLRKHPTFDVMDISSGSSNGKSNDNRKVKIDSTYLQSMIQERGLTQDGISMLVLGRSRSYFSAGLTQGEMKIDDVKKICTLLDLQYADVVIEEKEEHEPEQESQNGDLEAAERDGILYQDSQFGKDIDFICRHILAIDNDKTEFMKEFQKFSALISVFTEKQKQMDEEIANLLTTIKSQCVIQTNMMKEIINKMQ